MTGENNIVQTAGTAAVAWMYPLLRSTYGIVGNNAGLTSPTSRRWAGFAEILSQGTSALPRGAVAALVVGSIIGIILAIVEARGHKWVPSPTGVGIGMLVPFAVIVVMFRRDHSAAGRDRIGALTRAGTRVVPVRARPWAPREPRDRLRSS